MSLSLAQLLQRLPVTLALCAWMVGAFLVEVALGGATDLDTLVRLGAVHGGRISEHGEIWRLVTGIGLHGGWLHLVLNLLALVQLGALTEWIYGPRRMFSFFLVCGIAGNAVSVVGNGSWLIGQVGASGALFGLGGVILGLAWFGADPWSTQLRQRVARVLTFCLVFSLLMGTLPGLLGLPAFFDNWAHLGGLGMGLVLSLAYRDPLNAESRVDHRVFVGMLSLLVASLISVGIRGEAALDELALEQAMLLEHRAESSADGMMRAVFVQQAADAYTEASLSDSEERVTALIDDCSAETLRPLVVLWWQDGEQSPWLHQALEEWVDVAPDDPDALNALAWSLVTGPEVGRDPERAEALVDEALALVDHPDSSYAEPEMFRAAAFDTRAEALRLQGRMAEALQQQRDAVRLGRDQDIAELEDMEARLKELEAAQ